MCPANENDFNYVNLGDLLILLHAIKANNNLLFPRKICKRKMNNVIHVKARRVHVVIGTLVRHADLCQRTT